MIVLLAIKLADKGLLNLDDTLDTWLDKSILSRIVTSIADKCGIDQLIDILAAKTKKRSLKC
ncbi:MAG: CubicO group peptidase (beta-lactamase class C family) [Psychroserpens sp.]|jgi:CubicO group peptidase (beta-lactamase class C family)